MTVESQLRYTIVQDRADGSYCIKVYMYDGGLVHNYRGLSKQKAGFLLRWLGGSHSNVTVSPIVEVSDD